MQDQEHSADGQEDRKDPFRPAQREGTLSVCHLSKNFLSASLQQQDPENHVCHRNDDDKDLLALDFQTVKNQRQADQASLTGAQCAAQHDHQNEQVDDQLLGERQLAGRQLTHHNVCEGDHGDGQPVDDGKNGICVEAKSSYSLYTAMETVLNMPAPLRSEMGLYGREKMYREFDKSIVVKRTIETIESCIRQE